MKIKKFDFYDGLGFGVIMILFLIIQNLWLAEAYTLTTIVKVIIISLAVGTLAGFAFGFTSYWIKNSKYFSKKEQKL